MAETEPVIELDHLWVRAPEPEAALAQQLRLLWVLERVRAHAISVGRGAELAGLRYAEFLLLLGKHGISLFDYHDDELADELAPLR